MTSTIRFACTFFLALGLSFGVTAQDVQINKNRKLPPFPDLVIMRANYDQPAHTVNVWVMNRSKNSLAAACTLKLFGLRHKGLLIKEKLELTRPVPALKGGQSYVTVFDLPKPEGDIKTAVSKVVADSENVVHELNEANNVWSFFKDESAKGESKPLGPWPASPSGENNSCYYGVWPKWTRASAYFASISRTEEGEES